ncbi:MAG: PKD domain-containing protein [Methanobacterium sp.]|nr:PKD domain-containing protein [Methanobacterium sp.]
MLILSLLFCVFLTGTVSAATPSTNFTCNVTAGNAPLSVQFNDTSKNTPTQWIWNFGDNATSTEANPTHTYTKPGYYNVTLNASNDAGSNVLTLTNYINVEYTAPIANFSADKTQCLVPLTVYFTDNSVGDITSYAWDFNEDGVIDSTQKNPVYIYTIPGLYTVTETVFGPGGDNTLKIPNYILVPDTTPPVPKSNLPGGLYNSNTTVKLSAVDNKDTNPMILYTVNGVDPTRNSIDPAKKSLLYNNGVMISNEGITILKFIAVDNTGNVSPIITEIFKIDKKAPNAIANIKTGIYNTNKQIKLSMSESGLIYYTTNGTNPTKYSKLYKGPITIASTTSLKFMAVDLAGNQSPLYKMIYTIDKTAPKIKSTNPTVNTKHMSINSAVTIKFTEPVYKGYNYSKIYIKDLTTGKIAQSTAKISGNSLIIKTKYNLHKNSKYVVYLPKRALKDEVGNNAASYTLRYTTTK